VGNARGLMVELFRICWGVLKVPTWEVLVGWGWVLVVPF
jgi:hypothetical protein